MKRTATAFLLALLSPVLASGSASAETVTVGSPLTESFAPITFCIPTCISANTALGEPGARVTVLFDGTITRWRTIAASGGQFRIRVLRPTDGGQYIVSGASAPETPTGPGIDTFTTNVAVKAGT